MVIKASMVGGTNTPKTIAGTGTSGSSSSALNTPNGIFVNAGFDLYVADCYNNRIQLFRYGQLNATTVAGNGALGTIPLSLPVSVFLDGNGYVFITDLGNHRIIGSGPRGYRCIAGCTGMSGLTSYQLSSPRGFHFDSNGDLFVADRVNYRIQKFLLVSSCSSECRFFALSKTG